MPAYKPKQSHYLQLEPFFVMGGLLVVMAMTVHDGKMILLYPKSQKTQQLVTSDPKICLMTGGALSNGMI